MRGTWGPRLRREYPRAAAKHVWPESRITQTANKRENPMASREDVYAAIDSERDYQNRGAGNAQRDPAKPPMTTAEYILLMEQCLSDAREAFYHPQLQKFVTSHVRKVAALGVACMENHGAPHRK